MDSRNGTGEDGFIVGGAGATPQGTQGLTQVGAAAGLCCASASACGPGVAALLGRLAARDLCVGGKPRLAARDLRVCVCVCVCVFCFGTFSFTTHFAAPPRVGLYP